MSIPFGGDRLTRVSQELAEAFQPGDQLIVVQETGDLLHVPATEAESVRGAVDRAMTAFSRMGSVPDDHISAFYRHFAGMLEADDSFAPIAEANALDVERARANGRSATRLILSDRMRSDMISGLRLWAELPGGRNGVLESIAHEGWRVEQVRAGLGVVGFVFEGRPNVFADATGVLRSGNTVVFRIGSDALGTARAIVRHALDPALDRAGLPAGAAVLIESPQRSSGWALFGDRRLALAVARGSGPAVSQLGSVARQAGVPVSLHGTGGAWLMTSQHTDPGRFRSLVVNSLDRKVCNTLNTCCIVRSRAEELIGPFLEALTDAAGRRGTHPKLHVTADLASMIPAGWWDPVEVARAGGPVREPMTEIIDRDEAGREWEWEESPEVTLLLVDGLDESVDLFNRLSPRLVASLVSEDLAEQDWFFAAIDAPFVGDGMTRWVDGQYALDRPELGLSNWQHGRLLGRGGVLAGDSVFTIRTRMSQQDADLHR
jgi:glutamate-5-semialdehyde dehydrogenase